ncbi:PEF-CTERM sorting domain-containing protein [Methanococcoides sp. SA1]|nr:PEF-CTERM sorting domain-containing protein [Methanococcoides sp. SA1]
MRIKKNMVVCIGISLIFMLMFVGSADANGGGGSDYCVNLAPETSTNPVGTEHTVVARVTWCISGTGVGEGFPVKFVVIDGPHEGKSGINVTDENSIATWSYEGIDEGVDKIRADGYGEGYETWPSNVVTKTWTPQQEIPEFPTIALPIIAVIGLAFFFQRRRN